jgi:hypothetical protein
MEFSFFGRQNTSEILGEPDEADMLLHIARNFCPEAVPQIEEPAAGETWQYCEVSIGWLY